MVSHRLLKAADDAGRCHSRHATRGVLLQDKGSLSSGLAAEVGHDGALSDRLPVIGIDLQAAGETLLQVGGVVTAIDGAPAPRSVPGDWDSERPIDVTVSRSGRLVDFRPQSHPLCDIPVTLDESHNIGVARIQQGLMQTLADDDSLSLVIGHELGHILNGDSAILRIFDRTGSQEQ